jgi:hypothetical protein
LQCSASIIPNPPHEIFKQLNRKIFNFVHKSRERIKRNTLIGKESRGGINIADVESKFSSLKACLVWRLLSTKSSISTCLEHNFQKDNILPSYIIKTNLRDVKEYKDITLLPLLYKEAICAYNKTKMIKDISRITSDDFLSLPIWKNNLFQFKNHSIYFPNWAKSGVLYTKYFYDNDGVFRDWRYFEGFILHRNNSICEYYILKTMFNRYTRIFDCRKAPYINIKDSMHIFFKEINL